MKVEESLYWKFKKILFVAKETLLDENGAPKRIADIPPEEYNDLFMESVLLMLQIARYGKMV